MSEDQKPATLDIPLTKCDSSQLNATGYDADSQTLAVEFKNWKGEPTSLYHYSNVSQEQFDAFNTAESKGRHLGQFIKPFAEDFPFVKIRDRREEEKTDRD